MFGWLSAEAARVLRQVGLQQLDRSGSPQLHVAGQINNAHATRAQAPFDPVMSDQSPGLQLSLRCRRLRRQSAHGQHRTLQKAGRMLIHRQ
jgi:hypothetical protein